MSAPTPVQPELFTSHRAEDCAKELVRAAVALGWHGRLRWPIRFGGITFAAVGTASSLWAPGSPDLAGCVVVGRSPRLAIQDASLLAGYSPRAVLVPATVDAVDLRLQAAILDQGAVLDHGDRVELISLAGPVVPSLLQWKQAWVTDDRWLDFTHAVLSAPVLATVR